ncbi:hypothetical protein M433DRAFT_57172 [Acidomyces richmondensis BFW]|nr:MAG: hypothetical protein FE78DRAFT_135916 [Acidomyces sp. 'richmondensis']KYG50411.1 hypothetical protein M433DRAFT_57172 [Acidomyces richmondensis BFW]
MRVFNFGGPFLRLQVWTSQAPFRFYQRRHAQVHDVRLVATHANANAVQEKYKEKLEQKAREQGLSGIEELKEAHRKRISELRREATVPGANAPLSAREPPAPENVSNSIPFQAPPPPQPQGDHLIQTPRRIQERAKKYAQGGRDGVKNLESFIDVEKTAELPHKEIEALWRLRHVRDPQSLCAVMRIDTYRRLAETAKKHPQFILPLPREGQGAEIHFLQWTFPSSTTATVLFTHLAEFKLRGEFAQPHTTVTHHLDLSNHKDGGLVLMEGRVMENRGISVEEGKWLLMCLQKFYGFEAENTGAKENAMRRKRLMEQFTGGDEGFKVEELLQEAERVP